MPARNRQGMNGANYRCRVQSPIALVALLRPATRVDLLAATAMSSLIFTATPFLLPAVADAFDVSLGAASLISSAQLGGFVVASSFGGRRLRPSKRLLASTLLTSMTAQLLSAIVPWFSVLLLLRVASGVTLGLVAWLGWQEVFGDSERMGDLAVVGPVMGIAGAPLAAAASEAGGADLVFVAMAVLAVLPLPLIGTRPEFHDAGPTSSRPRSRPVPVARLILVCLALMTLGGSSVFIFAAAIGTDRIGMNPFAVSLAISANALLGIPPARYRGRRRWSGGWLIVTATMALLMTTVHQPVVFAGAIAVWGFAFWAGIPGVFTLLAERSAHPADRAGDAQAVMAAGRVFGPLLGGTLVEAGSFTTLGIVAAMAMAGAGVTLLLVEHRH